ncbi:hypothetical protein QYF36_026651 [Acer negundo]|nr:hypothetical protein QYF36_026651 [Acer negundo]
MGLFVSVLCCLLCWLFCFGRVLPCCSLPGLPLAFWHGCFLCVYNNVLEERLIVIESDSKVAMSWILDGDYGNLDMFEVIVEVRSKLRSYRFGSVLCWAFVALFFFLVVVCLGGCLGACCLFEVQKTMQEFQWVLCAFGCAFLLLVAALAFRLLRSIQQQCLHIIEEIEVDHDTNMKFVQKVVDIEWRKVFLGMTDERRMMWLSRL